MMQAMGTRSDSTGKNWVKRGLNLHLQLFFCQKCCKPVSNIYSGSRVSSRNKAIVGVDYLGADIFTQTLCLKISCRTKSVGKRILAQNIGPRITGDAVSILLRSSVPRRGYMRRTGHNPKK